MNTYYVLYDYGYYDDGEYGWQEFPSSEKALAFIEDIFKDNDVAKLCHFTLLEAKRLPLEEAEVVTKIRVGK